MSFREKLKEIREDRDISQKEIAEVLGVKQSAVSKYENGLREYKVEDIIKLCKFYNISADYILELPKMPYPKR